MQVMIKSWTGEPVPARVGMVVEIKGTIPQRCVVTDVKDGLVWFDSDVLGWPVLPTECTMISCHFHVGDDIEIYLPDSHDWLGGFSFRESDRYCFGIRHSNPNLRTKPEGNV